MNTRTFTVRRHPHSPIGMAPEQRLLMKITLSTPADWREDDYLAEAEIERRRVHLRSVRRECGYQGCTAWPRHANALRCAEHKGRVE